MIFSGIKFYNQNQNNDLIARAINSTLSPTDEIIQPGDQIRTGTITITVGSPTVTGSSTLFLTQCQVGQLFFTFVGGVTTLVGEVLSITDDDTLTLKSNSLIAGSGLQYAATNKLIRTNQSIYMMIPTIVVGNQFTVPAVRFIRNNTDDEGLGGNFNILSFAQASISNIPYIPTTPVQVPYFIRKITPVPGITNNVITSSQPVVDYGPSSNLPTKYWFLLDPFPITDPAFLSLLPNTTFQVFTQGDFNPFVVQNGNTFLSQALANTPNNSGGYY